MKVKLEPLDGVPVHRLTVSDPQEADVHTGECVGYRCAKCHQADETLDQIWHNENCVLCGEHGRAHYDTLEPDVDVETPTPEFDPHHEITVVIAATGLRSAGVATNEPLAFRCACGNLDEHLFEVVHDEACELSGPVEAPDGDIVQLVPE